MYRLDAAQLRLLQMRILNVLPFVIEVDDTGDSLWHQAQAALAEEFEALELYHKFGTWAVTNFGLLALERRSGYYPIARKDLKAGIRDWPEHMSEKWWCNMADFLRALYAADRIRFVGDSDDVAYT